MASEDAGRDRGGDEQARAPYWDPPRPDLQRALALRPPAVLLIGVKPTTRRRIAAVYTFAAGAVDAVTGPWLVVAPASALAAMGVEPEREPVFVSFVGVFVGVVGWSYLWALRRWLVSGDTAFLRSVWRVTILARLAAGTFVAAQVAMDNLDNGWLSVPATDYVLAALQIWFLRAGWPGPEASRPTEGSTKP